MGIWDKVKNIGETALNIGTLGGYSLLKDTLSGGDRISVPEVDPNAYRYGGSPEALEAWRQELAQRDALAGGRLGLDTRLSDEARGRMGDVYDRYGALARGEGPSLGREQLRAGLDQAQQQAAQQAASVRGGAGNALLAARYAQQTGAGLAAQTNQQAATLRAQEQLAAMQAQAGLAQQMRQGDLAARGMSEQRYSGSLDARMGLEQQQMAGSMAADAARRGDTLAVAQANQAAREAANKRKAAFLQSASETFFSAAGGTGGKPTGES